MAEERVTCLRLNRHLLCGWMSGRQLKAGTWTSAEEADGSERHPLQEDGGSQAKFSLHTSFLYSCHPIRLDSPAHLPLGILAKPGPFLTTRSDATASRKSSQRQRSLATPLSCYTIITYSIAFPCPLWKTVAQGRCSIKVH